MRSYASVVALGHSRRHNRGLFGRCRQDMGEDDSKACTCDDVMLLLKRRIFVESRG